MENKLDADLYRWVQNELFRYAGKANGSVDATPLSAVGSTSNRFLLTFKDGKSDRQFVVKRYQILGQPEAESRAQAQREYTALYHLQSISSALWSAPELIAFSEEYATLIMSYCPGRNVNEVFWNAIKWPFLSSHKNKTIKAVMNHVALIIKDLQLMEDCAANFPQSSPWLSGNLFEALIDSLLRKGVDDMMLFDVQQCVKTNLDIILAPANRSFQHTDLYFNNIIFDGNRYFILDFPNACYGSRYWDISHMVVSLEDYKIFRNVSAKAIDNCKEIFLEHFNIDSSLLQIMNLLHYCFSFNIRVNNNRSGIKKVLMKETAAFYENRIRTILDGVN